MCGEKFCSVLSLSLSLGSPPHVRGKAWDTCAYVARYGITPACAGKSGYTYRCCWFVGDHPRMCGEKSASKTEAEAALGSPPHVRGKVSEQISALSVSRITPACAGKSQKTLVKIPILKDHPRMCGEKAPCPPIAERTGGSPPHVRGKVDINVAEELSRRITPACAGKRLYEKDARGGTRDHPRMCGEKEYFSF